MKLFFGVRLKLASLPISKLRSRPFQKVLPVWVNHLRRHQASAAKSSGQAAPAASAEASSLGIVKGD